jgi:hypothetical protein
MKKHHGIIHRAKIIEPMDEGKTTVRKTPS